MPNLYLTDKQLEVLKTALSDYNTRFMDEEDVEEDINSLFEIEEKITKLIGKTRNKKVIEYAMKKARELTGR
jgi:Fe-S cluster assembly ATPase SufC